MTETQPVRHVFVQISDSGHLIPVEQPAELGRALRTFLSEETCPKG